MIGSLVEERKFNQINRNTFEILTGIPAMVLKEPVSGTKDLHLMARRRGNWD